MRYASRSFLSIVAGGARKGKMMSYLVSFHLLHAEIDTQAIPSGNLQNDASASLFMRDIPCLCEALPPSATAAKPAAAARLTLRYGRLLL